MNVRRKKNVIRLRRIFHKGFIVLAHAKKFNFKQSQTDFNNNNKKTEKKPMTFPHNCKSYKSRKDMDNIEFKPNLKIA